VSECTCTEVLEFKVQFCAKKTVLSHRKEKKEMKKTKKDTS